jgi:hypothetical protein
VRVYVSGSPVASKLGACDLAIEPVIARDADLTKREVRARDGSAAIRALVWLVDDGDGVELHAAVDDGLLADWPGGWPGP